MSEEPYGAAGGEVVRDEQAVAGTRLVHQRRRRRARAVEVQDDAGRVGPGLVPQERLRAQQAALFPVREEKDDVVARRGTGAQGARGLEQRGDTAAVVGRAGRRRHGVVVRDQQYRARGVASGQAGDDVVHHARHPRLARGHHLGGLHVRVQRELLEAAGDEVTHDQQPRRPDGTRLRGDDAQHVHGARGRELPGRRRGGPRPRRVPRRDRDHDHQDDQGDDECGEQVTTSAHLLTVAGGHGFATGRPGGDCAHEERLHPRAAERPGAAGRVRHGPSACACTTCAPEKAAR